MVDTDRKTTIVQRHSAAFELCRGPETHFKTRRQPRMAERQLDGGEFESAISRLKAGRPLEDGQMGNPGCQRLGVESGHD
jgi:hypothetical protein